MSLGDHDINSVGNESREHVDDTVVVGALSPGVSISLNISTSGETQPQINH